jgi:hypothetical protein
MTSSACSQNLPVSTLSQHCLTVKQRMPLPQATTRRLVGVAAAAAAAAMPTIHTTTTNMDADTV